MVKKINDDKINKMPIALFNGTVATTNGIYQISNITIEEAKALIQEHSYISAIGHEATAQAMSDLLGVGVEMNRIQFFQEVGQKAIVLKLNVRPPEGVILTREEIEKVGYSFKLMERLQ